MIIQKALIVDDDHLMQSFLSESLRRKKLHVTTAKNGLEAIEILNKEQFDIIFTDIKMPLASGIDVLKAAKELYPLCPVIMMTAYSTFENVIEAMNNGAFHYLIKPFSDDAIEMILEKTKEHLRLIEEHQNLKEQFFPKSIDHIISSSPAMQKIFKEIDAIASSQASIFITGESGTGKEVLSQYIHYKSKRFERSFIKVNCAAIPETLLESELFGHEKGAFTGAMKQKKGKFELAHEGTLLLDEVTEIPLSLQPKLLRAIQEKEIDRIGGSNPIPVNVRFIATSNRNLLKAVKEQIFREDLYYRLNVIPINIPPLRERKEDILPLCNHFLNKFCQENHKPLKTLSKEAEQFLLSYNWPGNIRELSNLIERIIVVHQERLIEKKDIPLQIDTDLPPIISENHTTIKDLERAHILKTLKAYANNQSQAAKALGITARTLRNKMKSYFSKID